MKYIILSHPKAENNPWLMVPCHRQPENLWANNVHWQTLEGDAELEILQIPSMLPIHDRPNFYLFVSPYDAEKWKTLSAELTLRFADFNGQKIRFQLLCNRFSIDVERAPLNLRMELIELQSNDTLRPELVSVVQFHCFTSDKIL